MVVPAATTNVSLAGRRTGWVDSRPGEPVAHPVVARCNLHVYVLELCTVDCPLPKRAINKPKIEGNRIPFI